MQICRLTVLIVLSGCMASAQRIPIIPITASNALKGAGVLFEDSQGGLWIGGCYGVEGVRYFDGTRFTNPVTGQFPHGHVSSIEEDAQGGIWLATSAGLLRLFQGRLSSIAKDQVFGLTKLGPEMFITNALIAGKFYTLRVALQHGGWHANKIATTNPYIRYTVTNDGMVLYPCRQGYCESRKSDIEGWQSGQTLATKLHLEAIASKSESVLRDRRGCIWIRSDTDARYQCPEDSSLVTLPARFANLAAIGEASFFELDNGDIVIPSVSSIAIGRPGHFRVLNHNDGLPPIASALISKDGSTWISNSDGLFVWPARLEAEHWLDRDGIQAEPWSILPINGRVFAVSADQVISLTNDHQRWQPIATLKNAFGISAGPDNTLFVTSLTQGVLQLTLGGQPLRMSPPARVLHIVESAEGQFWTDGTTVAQVRFQQDRIALQPISLPTKGLEVPYLLSDPTLGLWACYGAGLSHKSGDTWQAFKVQREGTCLAVAADHQGQLWHGGGQLFVVRNPQSPQPVSTPIQWSDTPRQTDCCNFLGVDKAGRLWRGDPDGVHVADTADALQGHWLHLNDSDGLSVGHDTNQGSFAADIDGSVWFGMGDSIIHMHPTSDLVHPTYAPTAFVSGFSSTNTPYQMAYLVSSIPASTNLTAHIGTLQMDRRSYLNFRYRIGPQGTKWISTNSLDVNLGTLPWGRHQLDIQARLGDGPWSAISSRSLTVLRPIWLSPPALIGFVFIGGLGLFGGHRWRRKLKQREDTPLPELAEWRLALVSPDLTHLQGSLLDGRFEPVRIVARGGFATVWEGRDHKNGKRLCAIKIFRHELLDKSWMDKRFQHEVTALTQISHPSVVRIYGHGNVPTGAPYLAMEFIHGQTLRDLLHRGRLARAQVASYLRQAASALAEIHAHGVCHRDVKPENLMIRTSAPAGEELVLIDFSIAIVQDPDETMHGLSRAAGTMHYMAPEQAIGYANESSDIYSLAKTLIEMLTGERLSVLLPDASIDLPERVREFLSELDVGLSRESVEIIAMALEFDPSRRGKDAREFGRRIARDLEA